MIRSILTAKNGATRMGGIELVDEWRSFPGATLWLDIEAESQESEKAILEKMNCHPLAIQDTQRARHPPKIEEFGEYTFILYRGIANFTAELKHEPQTLGFFIGKNILITCHPQKAVSIEKFFAEASGTLLKQGPGHLALRIMHTSAGLYLDALLEFETHLSDIEDTLMTNGNDELMRELVNYRSKLVKLRRLFNYHRNITDELRGDDYLALANSEDAMGHAITDLHDRFDRLYTMTEMFYSICGDLIDGYLSISSHQLNRTMQVLTVITAIFIPLGFLAGLYGMNFDHMPELHAQNGYFILLAVMGTIAVSLLIVFKKIRWL